MPLASIPYRFRVRFRVPAGAAFAWCTDFVPEDRSLAPPGVRRTVRRLGPETFLLTDLRSRRGSPVRITRLVRVDRGTRSWTNTHVEGPYLYSQFLYRVVADGPRRSHLEFRGLHLEKVPRPLSRAEVARRGAEERSADLKLWRERLAPAMVSDLSSSP